MDTGERVERLLPRITALRHRLHQSPELSGTEVETGAAIRAELAACPLRWEAPRLGTDLTALLAGRGPGPNVTLRADLDALPLCEAIPGPTYRSTHENRMHGCGHDGHCAMLVGAALVLSELREQFPGSVRLVWQPGEEVTALGHDLVDSGALEQPAPALVAALHGWPGWPVGAIVTRPGAIMAACNDFTVRISGRGGHGSTPEKGTDVIYAGALLINALQSVVSRRVAAQEPAVLSVCSFHGGTNANILPGTAELAGTLRFLDAAVGARIRTAVQEIAAGIAAATGTAMTVEFEQRYAPTINPPAGFALARQAAERAGVPFLEAPESALAAEDFSFYLQRYPGVYAWLGMGENSPALHAVDYDFNDRALAAGVRYLVELALLVLRG